MGSAYSATSPGAEATQPPAARISAAKYSGLPVLCRPYQASSTSGGTAASSRKPDTATAAVAEIRAADRKRRKEDGWDEEAESNTLEVHIHHLRKKLFSGLIRTVRGVGYLVEEQS